MTVKKLGVGILIILLLLSLSSAVYFALQNQKLRKNINNYYENIVNLKKLIGDQDFQLSHYRYLENEKNLIKTSAPTVKNQKLKINLFYYNRTQDQTADGNILCQAVLPVEREIPVTKTPIKDTLELLLKGQLTEEEKAQGFQTEFPHQGFSLKSVNLKEGILSLEFIDENYFTSGGSCRVDILSKEIILTAQQFPEVKDVIILPEMLFQP